ncbi:MAG: 3'(2'),5'-bisphosphate nucleotidase [Lacipirellulaceae bacterium]
MLSSPESRFAIDAVCEAALVARRVQGELVTAALTKGDKSPVTVGDFAAQAIVARRLQESGFAAPLVGEESAADLRAPEGAATLERVTHFVRSVFPSATPDDVCAWIDGGDREPGGEGSADYWTLDPIDGTKGFLRGDQYAVALALVSNGRVMVGALGCPELEQAHKPKRGGVGAGVGTVVCAIRGGGASWRDLDVSGGCSPASAWRPLRVSRTSDPAATRVLRSVEAGHTDMGAIDELASRMGIAAAPVGMDSQAKYAVLAAGGGEMILRLLSPDRPDYREKVWDQAAGSIVVEEAGGRVTDLDGKPLDFSRGRTLAANRGVLVTNGPLHDAALAALRAIHA